MKIPNLLTAALLAVSVPLLIPSSSSAHIGYVVSKEEIARNAGHDFAFLFKALAKPINVFLMLGAIAAVLVLYFLLKHNSFFQRKVEYIKERTKSYEELVSWMLRLSVGIALIGAGVANVLISPALPNVPRFSFFQILAGFLLLSGFLLTPVVWLVAGLFLLALGKSFYLFGNLEFFAASIALLILANPKPGLDDLLGISLPSPLKNLRRFFPLILRAGIGGAMMFLAVYEKFLNPYLSAVVVEKYHLVSLIPVSLEMWVLSAGIIEFLIGLALFVGFHTRLTSAIAFIVLTLSFFYFGEDVYSHITLFGVLSVLFVVGGGKLSIDHYYAESKQNI